MARASSFIPGGGIHALKAPVGLKATGAFSFEITGSSAGHGGGSARLIYSHESNPMNQFWSKIDMTNETGIAPAILRLYPRLDAGQRELIRLLEGPVLGIAGPGAGKTLSVALRAANILLLGKAEPGELLLCTYNADAAVELRQRLDAVGRAAGYDGDLRRTRVCTIHSLCGRLLAAYPERVGLKHGFSFLDKGEQWRFLYERFDEVFGPDLRDLEGRGWQQPRSVVSNALKYFDRICDELIRTRDLTRSRSRFLAAVGRCYRRYENLLLDENVVDFAHLQVWADLLLDDDDVADRISGGVRYLMCDEYQDTSYVQEGILLRLAERHDNLCVVGDEDQSLYRFRGASVQNILRFPERLPGCHAVELNVNYRSHPAIVSAYDRWMASADWSNPDPGGRPFRHAKTIIPHDPKKYDDYPAVIAIDGQDPEDEGRQLAQLLRFLKGRRVIAGYDQVALLLHSVRDEVAGPYQDSLECAGIPVRCAPAGSGRGTGGRQRAAGALTITTVHQAKGREWPVVIVGSLDFHASNVDPVGRSLARHCRRSDWEPARRIAAFDHMRQFYVAVSRPQDLLVLTASGPVHPRFDPIWEDAPRWTEMSPTPLAELARQRFRTVGDDDGSAREVAPTPQRMIYRLQRLDLHIGR